MSEEGTSASEGQEVVEQQEASTASNKRKTLGLGERIKVVDYLRSLVEPIVADSGSAIAAVVSAATQVEINWQQLKYMIDDLAEMNLDLGSKVHVKSAATTDDDRIAALEARIVQLESRMSVLATCRQSIIASTRTMTNVASTVGHQKNVSMVVGE